MAAMTPRAPLALLVAAAALLGCVERHYRFTFHKAQVSQEQLLRDQASLRKATGVVEVFATPEHDGGGSIEVETTEGHDIDIQQRLSAMGYVRGQH
jgi:hypothetical protein